MALLWVGRDVLTNWWLGQTFKQRAKEIDDQARNQRSILGEGSEFLRGLDNEERKRKTTFPLTSHPKSQPC